MHRTDAHALYQLITEFRQSGAPHLQGAWVKVLDAEYGTPEFVRRHGEVVELLGETVRQIALLPSEATRDGIAPYAIHWWRVVIGPDNQWGQQTPVNKVIGNEHLHLLGAAADVLESRFEATALAPGSMDLEPLRQTCLDWTSLISDDTELPAVLRSALLETFEHLLWLIDNAGLFGVSRVVRAGQTTLGSVALSVRQVSERHQPTWRSKMVDLAGNLIIITGLMTATTTAIEAGTEMTRAIGEVVTDLTDADGASQGDGQPKAD